MPKALVLVGGFGTRLRPLTFSKPKPLVEFCNMAILEHQIAALASVGVTEIVLAVSYRPDEMADALRIMEAKYKLKLTVSVEAEPMGTAGPLALARSHLEDTDVFFVFNSDVTCEYPLREMLAFHAKHGGEGTICVTRVDDPSKYGVVVHDEAGRIARFVEKPTTFVGDHINAGLYVFSPSILRRIEMRPTSIEKETFPAMASDGQLFAMALPGYWMDIGQPKDYIKGTTLHLAGVRAHEPARLAAGEGIVGNVLVDPSATVGRGCLLGPDVVIGPGCVVEDGVRLSHCTLLGGATVRSHASVAGSIIGWKSTVGRWARVEGGAVLGEDVSIADEKVIVGTIVLPHKALRDSYFKPGEIVM